MYIYISIYMTVKRERDERDEICQKKKKINLTAGESKPEKEWPLKATYVAKSYKHETLEKHKCHCY